MSDKAVLEEATNRAIKGGLKNYILKLTPFYEGDGELVYRSITQLKWYSVEHIIYNHEFAKSLFGEYGYIPEAQYKFQYKKNSGVEKTRIFTIASAVSPWQYHLQMMVISPDPIEYLRNYIKENQ